jgi:hypothetical protein
MARKILVLNKGRPGEWYGQAAPDGGPLRCRRVAQCGRLELLRIVNDPPAYWFVMVRNFDESTDSPDRKALRSALGNIWLGNGVWRFLECDKAKAHFDRLSKLPIFIQEQARRLEIRAKSAERLKAVRIPFPRRSSAFLP